MTTYELEREALLDERRQELLGLGRGHLDWEYLRLFGELPGKVNPPVEENIVERMIGKLRAEMDRED